MEEATQNPEDPRAQGGWIPATGLWAMALVAFAPIVVFHVLVDAVWSGLWEYRSWRDYPIYVGITLGSSAVLWGMLQQRRRRGWVRGACWGGVGLGGAAAAVHGWCLATDHFDVQAWIIEGRPLRDGYDPLLPAMPTAPGEGLEVPAPDEPRGIVLRHWLEIAREEQASVPAFLKLARDCERLGAPGKLGRAARRAAREEIGHARLALVVAEQIDGRCRGAGRFPPGLRAAMARPTDRATLAVEAFVDGVLGEGLAVERARAALPRVRTRILRDYFAAVVEEEARHRDLGEDLLRWACADLDLESRTAVLARCRKALAAPLAPRHADLDPAAQEALVPWGIVPDAEAERRYRARILPAAAALLDAIADAESLAGRC